MLPAALTTTLMRGHPNLVSLEFHDDTTTTSTKSTPNSIAISNTKSIQTAPAPRENNASAKQKKRSRPAARRSPPSRAEGLEGGFKTTYKPSLFEEGWLLDSLRPFYEMGLILDVMGRVKGGKEANVYRVEGSSNLGGGLWAAKVYRPQMFRTMKNDSTYREGRSTLNSEGHVVKQQASNRVIRALAKKSSFGREVAHGSWLMHEYGTLQKLHAAALPCRRPVASAGTPSS